MYPFSTQLRHLCGLRGHRTVMLDRSQFFLLLLCSTWCLAPCVWCAEWRSCGSASAAFDIRGINLAPEVVPPGGTLKLVVDVLNKLPSVTAGSATVKVYYYGWWVLTATGTICEAPAAATTAAVAALDDSSSSVSSVSTAHRRSLLGSRSSWAGSTWLTTSSSSSSSRPDSSTSSSSTRQQRHAVKASTGSSAAMLVGLGGWARLWGDTCVLPGGPLELHHDATLPGIAPKGNYRMQLLAEDPSNGTPLFCLDVWFKVAT